MTTDQKRVIVWCLRSEIDTFNRELARRGPRKDHYGEPTWDVALAHTRLLESALAEVERMKVNA